VNKPSELIFELLIASDELLLKELFYGLQDYLIEERSIWIQDNLIFVFNIVSTLSDCKKLYHYCIESILKDRKLFINTKDFPIFDKDILCELLKRDDFLIYEINIWDYLIRWSIEKTPSLKYKNSDRTKWNNEDYEALKETFNQFIPLIRFSEISSIDFFDKVRPFKAIIPNNIYEKFMEFHMKGTLLENTTLLLPRIGKLPIDSKIIKPEHAYVIANWIEGKDAKAFRHKNDLQYKFNLLYSSSKDGFDVDRLNRKCINKGPCLILIKSQHTRPTDWPLQDSWDSPARLLSVPVTSDSWDSSASRIVPLSIPIMPDSWDSSPPGSWDSVPQTSQSLQAPQTSQTLQTPQTLETPTQNLAKIHGEYYSSIFTQDTLKRTTKNFIFSFANDDDVKNSKISRMNHDFKQTKSGCYFNLSDTFRIKGQIIYVNNLSYNDNNVINSNITRFFSTKIEIFEVSDGQNNTSKTTENIGTSSWW
jgi:hypothetical protein